LSLIAESLSRTDYGQTAGEGFDYGKSKAGGAGKSSVKVKAEPRRADAPDHTIHSKSNVED
jgi:hypothetical protein